MEYLLVKDLKIGYTQPLTPPLSFHLNAGELLQINGANGSGKSTLLKTLQKEIPSRGGLIEWKIPRSEISYLPQQSVIAHNFNFTLGEILETYEISPEVIELLPKQLINRLWVNASGGEKQLTLILTRILKNTKVLILDEPFNHLDQKAKKYVENLIDSLMSKRAELSIILVSHLNTELKKRELYLC